jgi:aminoglycoside phosphotransferase (APT) family kinase protein
MIETPPNTRPPRDAHRIDEAALGRWLGAHVEGCSGAPVAVAQFKGGQSNPTYFVLVDGGKMGLVVRKKPPGKLLPSAHAIEREYRIMRGLGATDVPVPDALALCEDASVIGTPFFVMRWVPGHIFWDTRLPDQSPDERRAIYREYARVLGALHTVDFRAVGLGDYGKIGGFVSRQVERWSSQYKASRTAEIAPMEALMTWLAANIPAGEDDETTLVHGDYRLDNLMFSLPGGRPPEAAALLDWELSTLGHPLSDLAYACLMYHVNLPGRGGLVGVDVGPLGIPTEDEMVDAYVKATGGDRERFDHGWPFFLAFGLFRLAAIAQGVYARSLQGNASSDDAGAYGAAVKMLAELACGIAKVPV